MIHVPCPKCSKSYQLADDKAGRVFRCEQCGGKVKVPDAIYFDDAWSPRADPKKWFAIPTHQAGSPTHTAPSGGGVAVGIAIGAVLFLIAAAIFLFVLAQRQRNLAAAPLAGREAAPGENPLPAIGTVPRPAAIASEFLPRQAPVMLAMDFSDVWNDPSFRQMFGPGYDDGSFAKLMVDHLGVHPTELRRVSVALLEDGELSEHTPWIATIDLANDVDWSRRTHPRFTSRNLASETLFDLKDVFSRDYAVWQPQSNMLVFGDVSLVERIIARGPHQEPRANLQLMQGSRMGMAIDLRFCEWACLRINDWELTAAERQNWLAIAIAPNYDANDKQWTCEVILQSLEYISRDDQVVIAEQAGAEEGFDALAVEAIDSFPLQRVPKVKLSGSLALHNAIGEYLLQQIAWMKTSVYQIAGVETPSPLVGDVLQYGADD